MKKRIVTLLTAGCMILSVCGCGQNETDPSHTTVIPETEHIELTIIPINDGADTEDSDGTNNGTSNADGAIDDAADGTTLPFTEFHKLNFMFCSGAGAWQTNLSIRADGSFAGEYLDADMGSIGDGYPRGTNYQCVFNGQFSQPVKINDYTYSMQILSMTYSKDPGTSEIRDGILYKYSTAYGLDGAEAILIYLPGAPLAELPEGFRSWVGYYYLENTTDTELPFYGLYNEAEAEGFSSYDLVENRKDHIAYVEEAAAILEDSIEHDALCQAEYNLKSAQLYQSWDSALNAIWGDLRQITDAETMRALTDEQLAWIAMKEQAVSEAGAEYEGGSIQPFIMNMKAAELTKLRVYELMALLES